MSIFDTIFPKKKSVPKDMTVEELREFVEQQVDSRTRDATRAVNEDRIRIRQSYARIRSGAESLRTATLKTPPPTERVGHVLEGNRESYLKRLESLLSKLEPMQARDIDEAHRYFASYTQEMTDFTKSSTRAFLLVREFYGVHMATIATAIKELDLAVTECAQRFGSSSKSVSDARSVLDAISSYTAGKQRHAELLAEAEELAISIDIVKKESDQTDQALSHLLKTKSYREYKEMLLAAENAKKALASEQQRIADDFHTIAHALKKFSKSSLQTTLIQQYVDDPLLALEQDTDVLIAQELVRLGDELRKGELEQKERENEKALSHVTRLSQGYLAELRKAYIHATENRITFEQQANSHAALLRHKELEYRQDYLRQKTAKISTRQEHASAELAAFNEESLLQALQAMVKQTFEKSVTILSG